MSRLSALLLLAVGLGVGLGVIITQSERPSPTSPTIDGVWTISRTVTLCENLSGGCRTDPFELRFDNCDDTKCVVTRSNDPNWPTGQEIRREGPDLWVARFDAPSMKCRNVLNLAAHELRLIVADTDARTQPAKATALGGTFTSSASTNPPDCAANPHSAFTLSGTRTGPDQVQSPSASNPKAVQAWFSGGGQKVGGDVTDALNRIIVVLKAKGDNDAIKNVCSTLRTAVETAQAYPTIPDPDSQELWSTELSQAARASTDCVSSMDSNDSSIGERAGFEVTASIREANHLHDHLSSIGVN